MSNIAVIIGREGSKRIKNKNFKKFNGKSVIEWSLEAVLKTKIFDEIIISTDKKKSYIKNKKIENYIYFQRPKKFSSDNSATIDAVIHSINWFQNYYYSPKFVCCVYACSPLIQSNDIVKAYKKIRTGKWNYVTSATKYRYPIERSFKLKNNSCIKMNFPRNYKKNSQSFGDNYHDAGQFYWGKTNAWLNKKKFFDKNSTIQNIPSIRVTDIDSLEDWNNALIISKKILHND